MPTTLLCSLGTSWPIVIEAFIRPDCHYDRVWVLTSDSPRVLTREIEDYFAALPNVEFCIIRVAGFTDLQTDGDHRHFEEVLLRWYLEALTAGGDLDVCLAGGFKTMSSSMQQAARLFGASSVFHVLAQGNPGTLAEIETAGKEGRVHYIQLNPECGWLPLRQLRAADYPLDTISTTSAQRRVQAGNFDLQSHIQSFLVGAAQLSASIDTLSALPFVSLGRLTPLERAWLEQPLDPATDTAWVRGLPKLELHSHLGGFATHGLPLDQVRNARTSSNRPKASAVDHNVSTPSSPAGINWKKAPASPAGWPTPVSSVSLHTYMHLGDANGSTLLGDPGCLQRQCELLYAHLLADRVLYAEIRCSPNNYANPQAGRSAWVVLEEIRAHFQRCMDFASDKGSSCHVNLIIIATRKDSGDRSDISRHLALAITAAQHWTDPQTCQVVGVDLAGFERKETRAALFQTDFEAVHRVGLAVTVHAGENDDAEGIWQAVFKLNARRLGHALHLEQSPDLLRAVADRAICLEMCPYANYQIHGYRPQPDCHDNYPLADYLAAGVRVTVNTDNIGISAASLSDNLLFLATLCPGIRRIDLLHLQANAIGAAFTPETFRTQLRSSFERQLTIPPAL